MNLNISYVKIKEVFYEHWKMVFPYLVPFVVALLFSFRKSFRDIMVRDIPFWVFFISLILIGCLITIILSQQKRIKDATRKIFSCSVDTVLLNNLVYKIGDESKQAYCPYCFEKSKGLKRMSNTLYSNDYQHNTAYSLYQCFFCEKKVEVPLEEEVPF